MVVIILDFETSGLNPYCDDIIEIGAKVFNTENVFQCLVKPKSGKLISEKISGKSERFNFFSKIKHFSIPGGDFMRRPIYASAITFYKIKDFFNFI